MKNFNAGRWLCYCIALAVFIMTMHAGGHHAGLDLIPSLAFAAILPATALQEINLETESAWPVNQRDIDMSQIDAESFRKFLEMQKAAGGPLVQPLVQTDKDNEDVKIWWPDFCGQEAEDCVETGPELCDDLTADPSGVESKTYNITQCLNDKFSINENTFAGSWLDFKQFLVREQGVRIRNILNKLNVKTLLFLHANAGYNGGNQFTLNGDNQAEVDPSEFDDTKLITKLLLDAEINNIRNAYIITGDPALWITLKNVAFDAGNAEGKGDEQRRLVYDTTLDVRGFMKVPELAGSTFAVTPYAGAFVTKNYYENSAPLYDNDAGKAYYHVKIPAFGLRVDVLHQRVCVDMAKKRFNHIFNYRLHYDFIPNPTGCPVNEDGDATTGILEYLNTGAVVSS